MGMGGGGKGGTVSYTQVHNVRVGYSERKGQGPSALNTSNFSTQSMHSLSPMIILFFHLLLSCCKM